jgi:hypothetical protein
MLAAGGHACCVAFWLVSGQAVLSSRASL